jgi:hypothetical protein
MRMPRVLTYTEGNTRASVSGEDAKVRRSPQAVAPRHRAAPAKTGSRRRTLPGDDVALLTGREAGWPLNPKGMVGARSVRLMASASARVVGLVKAHAQRLALEGLAVECGHGRSGLVPFHFDESEAAAFAREDVGRQTYRTDGAELGKQLADGLFRCIGGQVADEHFLQILILAVSKAPAPRGRAIGATAASYGFLFVRPSREPSVRRRNASGVLLLALASVSKRTLSPSVGPSPQTRSTRNLRCDETPELSRDRKNCLNDARCRHGCPFPGVYQQNAPPSQITDVGRLRQNTTE